MPERSFSKQKLDLLCRRSFLGSSGLGILGLSFPQCLSAAATAGKNVKAKNVLVIYEQGGPVSYTHLTLPTIYSV